MYQSCKKRSYVKNLLSLSEKTKKSNHLMHLQMPLQRRHFLLSYLKTLSARLRSRACETRARVKITPARKRDMRRVAFSRVG